MATRRQLLGMMLGGLLAPWEGIRRVLGFEKLPTFIGFRNGWSCRFLPSAGGEVQDWMVEIARLETDCGRQTGLRDLMYGELSNGMEQEGKKPDG